MPYYHPFVLFEMCIMRHFWHPLYYFYPFSILFFPQVYCNCIIIFDLPVHPCIHNAIEVSIVLVPTLINYICEARQ